jgi:hypothetical protein
MNKQSRTSWKSGRVMGLLQVTVIAVVFWRQRLLLGQGYARVAREKRSSSPAREWHCGNSSLTCRCPFTGPGIDVS